jgi:hypothetical protein
MAIALMVIAAALGWLVFVGSIARKVFLEICSDAPLARPVRWPDRRAAAALLAAAVVAAAAAIAANLDTDIVQAGRSAAIVLGIQAAVAGILATMAFLDVWPRFRRGVSIAVSLLLVISAPLTLLLGYTATACGCGSSEALHPPRLLLGLDPHLWIVAAVVLCPVLVFISTLDLRAVGASEPTPRV